MTPMEEAKSLAVQGSAHPDPAVRADVLARQRRWARLSWLPAVAAAPCFVALPVLMVLATTTFDWRWMAAAVAAVIVGVVAMCLAFAVWLVGETSGWLAGPNLPQVSPAALPLKVRLGFSRAPIAVVLVLPLVIYAEFAVLAIVAESARHVAVAGAIAFGVILLGTLFWAIAGGWFQPQVIIEADGVRFPPWRVSLRWEQVAAIRA